MMPTQPQKNYGNMDPVEWPLTSKRMVKSSHHPIDYGVMPGIPNDKHPFWGWFTITYCSIYYYRTVLRYFWIISSWYIGIYWVLLYGIIGLPVRSHHQWTKELPRQPHRPMRNQGRSQQHLNRSIKSVTNSWGILYPFTKMWFTETQCNMQVHQEKMGMFSIPFDCN